MLSGLLNAVARPLLLQAAIRSMDPAVPLSHGLGVAGGLAVTLFFETWSKTQGIHLAGDLAVLRASSAAMYLISLKAGRLETGSASEGVEQTLLGKDIIGVAEMARYLPMLLIALSSLVGGLIVLFLTAGLSGGVGVLVMFSTLLVSMPLGRKAKEWQAAMLKASESTTGVTREILDGVKVVKFMGWEAAYLEHVGRRRAVELGFLRLYRTAINIVVQIGRASPVVATLATCLVLGATAPLRADVVLPIISLFQSLRVPFIMLPMAMQIVIQVQVAARRISAYLQLPEQPLIARAPAKPDVPRAPLAVFVDATICWPKPTPAADAVAARAKAATRRRPSRRAADALAPAKMPPVTTATGTGAKCPPPPDGARVDVLRGLSLSVEPSSVIALVGPVSAGKTSLLSALWGEAAVSRGSLTLDARVAVVPQRPFTIGGTLLDNILLGRPLDETLLRDVLEGCALLDDLDQLPLRELTEVGERGVTLSGGQQQRVALARALYGRPDLLLLDDPLSAVDARTAVVILDSITRYVRTPWLAPANGEEGAATLRRRAAVVSVSQGGHLHAFDRMLLLEAGRVVAYGDRDALLASGSKLATQLLRGSDAANASLDDMPETAAVLEATAGALPAGALAGSASAGSAATAKPAGGDVSRLTVAESKRSGAFSSKIYSVYLRALGRVSVSAYLLLLCVTYASYLWSDLWLVRWIRDDAICGSSLGSPPAVPDCGGLSSSANAGIYSALALGHVIVLITTSIFLTAISVRASGSMHRDTIKRVLYAPMGWYDATPSGRVLSRFTSDLNNVDVKLSMDMDNVLQMIFMVGTLVGYIAAASWVLCLAAIGIFFLFCVSTVVADRAVREVRRIANNAVSPVMSTISEFKAGAALMRAMELTPFFAARQSAFIGEWSHISYMARALQSWSSHVGGMLAFLLGSTTALYIVGNRALFTEELGGLALTYATVVPYFLNIVSEMFVQMRTSVAALERLLDYLDLPQEPEHERPDDPPIGQWPTAGRIEFLDLCMRYRPGLPLALQDLSATVEAGAKVGIVGRTGAGKSTLVLALFRLVEPASGTVLIDGRETSSLGLHTLRRAMTIIPQDPVLHDGTVAHNLWPFGNISDDELRSALVRARLPADMLHAHVAKGGTNLSSGERQLLCFARAMLAGAHILILDEATSNLDEAADAAMQALLRDEFASKTLLTIAHRLLTVADYDSILVLGAGRLLEQGAPATLLADEASVLSSMAAALGDAGRAALIQKAAQRRTHV